MYLFIKKMTSDIENQKTLIQTTKDDLYCFKCYTSCCVVIFVLPLIICDLYFGFSDNECLTQHSNQFNFKLKTYLITYGLINLSLIIIYIVTIHLLTDNDETNIMCILFDIGITNLIGTFFIIWNILCAVLFWDYIYPNNLCNSSLSMYIFVSLIIKLIGSFSLVCKSTQNED